MTHAYQPGTIPTFERPDRIRKSLQVASVGVADMAEYIGVTRETLSRYLNGKQPAPLAAVRLIALRTGVPFEWIQQGECAIRDSNPEPADKFTARHLRVAA